MPLRTRIQIACTFCLALAGLTVSSRLGSHGWGSFSLLLLAVLLSSGLKIALPRGDGSMTLNFPFIFLGIVQLSPLQAMLLAGLSVAAQCRIRVHRIFTAVQIFFNVANTMVATSCAVAAYVGLHTLHVGTAPALAGAAVVFFLWTTGSVAMVLASTKGEDAFQLWRSEFPWYLPFYLVGALLATLANWMRLRFGWGTALLLIPCAYLAYRAYTGQVTRLRERQQHLEETEALHLRTIEGLAMAIEAKDQGTHDHLFRVRHYVKAVGEAMHLSRLELQALETAAFLHDIGKLAVPEHIINKPGRLTPEEFEKMKIHPVVGADILERVRFPYPVVPIVRSHHEWWNGTGYPDGLRGTDIPLGARVLTVVDCFDALVSDRPYRKGLAEGQALSMIRSLSGKQFDPRVVEIFEGCHAKEETRQPELNHSKFTPLNTEVEVWRGLAPGAGFEAGSDQNASSTTHALLDEKTSTPPQEDAAVLDLVAVASYEAQTIFELSQTLGDALTPEETLGVIALRLRRIIPHELFCLYLKETDSVALHFQDGPTHIRFSSEPMHLGEGITGWVASSGKPLLNGNAAVEPGCPLNLTGAPALRSGLSIPLFNLQREVFAVLTLYSAEVDSFSRGHLRTLLTMESKLSLALQNLRGGKSSPLEGDADFLTALPNARRLFIQLEAALLHAEGEALPLSVLVCDVNSFREINEHRGQLAANRVLRLVANVLRTSCLEGAFIARMGGDEFTVLFPGLSAEEVQDRSTTLRQALVNTGRRAGQGIQLSASFGTATFPEDGLLAEDLLAAANRRMHLEKRHFYSLSTATSVQNVAAPSLACNG